MKPRTPSRGGGGAAAPTRHHPHHNKGPSFTPAVVLLGVVVLAFTLWNVVSLQHQAHQHASSTARHLAPLPSISELYGAKAGLWPPSAAAGPSQLLVLGYYGSTASLVARLLMLMGVFAGDAAQLRIDPTNRLRWWELKQLSTLNDLMLSNYASPGLPHQLGRGFHAARLSAEHLSYYADRLDGMLRYLNTHRPWLVKDPRMAWLAPLWLERLDMPLCVIVANMQPERLAQHLSSHPQAPLQAAQRPQQAAAAAPDGGGGDGEGGGGSGGDSGASGVPDVSASTHLERWTNATLSSIKACFAVPTIVVPSSVLAPPLLQPFLAVLHQHLKLAGVQGTRLPDSDLLQQQYVDHLHTAPAAGGPFCGSRGSNTSAAAAAGTDGAALLQDACNWLPPKPHTGSAGAVDGGAAGPDATLLPVPARALLEALHDHLAAHLAHPDPQLQYAKVAGQLYTAYARRVKELVAQGGGSHAMPHHAAEHHSIGALVLDALRHLETSVVEAAGGARQLRGHAPPPHPAAA